MSVAISSPHLEMRTFKNGIWSALLSSVKLVFNWIQVIVELLSKKTAKFASLSFQIIKHSSIYFFRPFLYFVRFDNYIAL